MSHPEKVRTSRNREIGSIISTESERPSTDEACGIKVGENQFLKKNRKISRSSKLKFQSNISLRDVIFQTPVEKLEFNKKFLQAIYPHVASFNTFLEFYIPELVKDLEPTYVDPLYERIHQELDPYYCPTEYLKIYVRSIKIGRPVRTDAEGPDKRLFPRTCRNGHMSYSAPIYVEFVHDNVAQQKKMSITRNCGTIPIMVRSNRCHLDGIGPEEVISLGEECNEAGGYFIINGNERVIRFVVQQRCNHPIALKKPRFKSRDLFFGENAILIRCAKKDGTSTANILFHTEDNQCAFRALINRQECVVPFWTLLRALMPSISMELIKRKMFETEFDSDDNPENLDANGLKYLPEMEMLWKEFVDYESIFTDIDKYENRYLHLLGKIYWDLVSSRLKPGSRYEDAGRLVINKYILVHCESWTQKFECLLILYRKLLALVRGYISAENMDSFAYQEVVTPGQLFAGVLKDAIFNVLGKIRLNYLGEIRVAKAAGENPLKVIRSKDQFDLILRRTITDISHTLAYFMATGNIKTTQLDVQQMSGWTVVADRLNINRFLSHFRAVHRGQFFAQMRTTEVRKLLGETWGFLCPVHTPDGGPCGLLLHLTQDAIPVINKKKQNFFQVTDAPDGKALAAFKVYLNQRRIPVDMTGHVLTPPVTSTGTFPLLFDGIPLCRLPRQDFDHWIDELRRLKQTQEFGIPQHLEVAAFRKGSGAFEGIFIFSYPGRIVRSVKCLKTGLPEWVGPLGQPWMNIACLDEEVQESTELQLEQKKLIESILNRPEDVPPPKATSFKELVDLYREGKLGELPTTTTDSEIKKEKSPEDKIHKFLPKSNNSLNQTVPVNYTHVELNPDCLLSITSALTPYSHHNQSPRNMYQCQMLKQTMGTPFHSIPYRTDNKAYRLLFPQVPCVRADKYIDYQFNEYPTGTNAVVAVIAYTGFDMEDAMILNKGSLERGAFHAVVYKTKLIDAAPPSVPNFDARKYIFNNRTFSNEKIKEDLDTDGLPSIGTLLENNKSLYRTTTTDNLCTDTVTKDSGHLNLYHDDELAYVDKINLISPFEFDKGNKNFKGPFSQRVSLKLRCVRNPVVGDKFASRAGQKGILSMLWPSEDMPFSASGLVPDIVFNPHGFPSRMTVGMLIESMAGKSAAIHGKFQDCTPFKKFPRQKKFGNPWIDNGGYNGWVKRNGRYMTEEEDNKNLFDTSADYFGKELLKAGYQYYGTEPLYSGIHGVEMTCNIFIGIIYYQRLRHMVSDKWQVRSTGPIDALTRQPVKGRKRGGGVRFGEMERDALLAHGTCCLLQDRLMHCSDEHKAFVCPACGSILSPCLTGMSGRTVGGKKPIPECRICEVPCRLISIPFVFRYICNELAAMNITIRLHLSERGELIKVKPNPEISSVNKMNKEVFNNNKRIEDNAIYAEVDEILGIEEKINTNNESDENL